MSSLYTFYTLDGERTGTLDRGSLRIERRYLTFTSEPVIINGCCRMTLNFKGVAGHPGVNPELWHPALSAACSAAVLIDEQVKTIQISQITGKGDEACLVLTVSEGQQNAVVSVVQQVLDMDENFSMTHVEESVEHMEVYPHLLVLAKLIVDIHDSYPVMTFHGSTGLGYIVPNQVSWKNGATEFITGATSSTRDSSLKMLALLDQKIEEHRQTFPESVSLAIKSVLICESIADAIDAKPEVLEPFVKAMKDVGIEPVLRIVAGGTDGGMQNLKLPELPCPNLWVGGASLHSVMEHVAVKHLEKLGEVVIRASRYLAEQAT